MEKLFSNFLLYFNLMSLFEEVEKILNRTEKLLKKLSEPVITKYGYDYEYEYSGSGSVSYEFKDGKLIIYVELPGAEKARVYAFDDYLLIEAYRKTPEKTWKVRVDLPVKVSEIEGCTLEKGLLKIICKTSFKVFEVEHK